MTYNYKSNFKILLFFALLICSISTLRAETNFRKNYIYGEILGNAGLGSINYERLFTKEISLRTGFSRMPNVFGTEWYSVFPVSLNYIIGASNHKFEVGGGIVFVTRNNETGVISNLSYRFQPSDGFLFRLSFTPFLSKEGVFYWGGISIGHGF